jgi:hypothetical protein
MVYIVVLSGFCHVCCTYRVVLSGFCQVVRRGCTLWYCQVFVLFIVHTVWYCQVFVRYFVDGVHCVTVRFLSGLLYVQIGIVRFWSGSSHMLYIVVLSGFCHVCCTYRVVVSGYGRVFRRRCTLWYCQVFVRFVVRTEWYCLVLVGYFVDGVNCGTVRVLSCLLYLQFGIVRFWCDIS